MLIDNEKFIGLLAENSGLEKEKVEKYLAELIEDIRTAFEEDEGYEVDGFGIFSKLGSNILFIPSEELATEINYKYVGMEPIELPGGKIEELQEDEETEENPIQGLLDGGESGAESQEYEDPFAELFNEAEEHEKENNVESTDEDIEAAVEEEIENEDLDEDVFSEISEDQEEEIETPSLVEEEVEKALEENDAEKKAGPDQWGIDAHKEDDQEGAFSGLFSGDTEEDSELVDEEDIFATEEELENIESEENQEEASVEPEAEIDFSALEENKDEESEKDEFDDPFAELEEETEETEEAEDFVPVVTNVSSESAAKSKLQEDDVADDSDDNKTNSEPEKVELPKSPRDRKQSSPVFLYMILALVILGGTGYILAYFGIVDINGITPPKYKTQVTQATTPVNQQNSTPPQTTESEEVVPPRQTLPEVDEENTNPTEEGASSTENNEASTNETPVQQSNDEDLNSNTENDLAPLVADEKAPGNAGSMTSFNEESNADTYGLKGTVTEAGNNGYTIVLYTLSRKAGADAQLQKLTQDGYRTIIKERPSEQYGVLYRVSIGQFKTLADAAIAAEQVDSSILGNYIITKI